MLVKQFPQMVYGPGNAQMIINGPDEMPKDFMTFHEKHRQGYTDAHADAAAGAVIAADGAASSKKAADDAQEARDAATKAQEGVAEAQADEERMHRDRLKAFLTEHNVDFVPQSGTAKLENLAAQLREHLAATAPENADDTSE